MGKYKLNDKFVKRIEFIISIAMVNNNDKEDVVRKKLINGFSKDSVIYQNMFNYGYLFWLTKIMD